MKILHAAETIKGGVESVICNLIDGQTESAHEHCYVFVFPRSQVDKNNVFYGKSPYHFRHTGRGLASLVLFFAKFATALWKENPDVVHLHSTFAGAIGRLTCLFMRPFRKPAVIYCPHAFAFMMDGPPFKRKVYAYVERLLAPIANKIICVSKYEYDQAIYQGLPRSKLTLIYNGVPTPPYPPAVKAAAPPLRLLYVGRFDRQKGIDILCTALKSIPSGRAHLTAVGGTVHDAGFKPDFPPSADIRDWVTQEVLSHIYAAAHLLIVPSRWEGFAMTPLEGMAHGLPIIASDCTSLPEAVRHQVNGYIFPSGDAEALACLIADIEVKMLPEMAQAAFDLVSKEFSASKMIELTHEVYESSRAVRRCREDALNAR